MNRTLDLLSSTLASTLRGWRGTSGSKSVTLPAAMPILFDREGCAQCRLVREALTELNMDAMIYPCPEQGTRHLAKLKELSGGDQVPFLHDPNTDQKLHGAHAIVEYLFQQYRGRSAPRALQANRTNLLMSKLATGIRFQGGVKARPSHAPAKPMTLYSFESSPFSRLVRERLCELEIPYQLINLSKQQRADMGPATFRMHRGAYRPLPNSKREAFLNTYGNVQVPFLIDPNSGLELFESAEIVRHLDKSYRA
jgi:glutathione S-transferase